MYLEYTYKHNTYNTIPSTMDGIILAMVSVKSVVVGIHSWLPDAMEGPTGVSAVIHAATLVVAGVLMVSKVLLLLWIACMPIHIIA